jgi:hypothetical protein
MIRCALLIGLVLLSSRSALAQFSNTVQQFIGTGATGKGVVNTTGPLPPTCTPTLGCISNIGQSQHTLTILWGNAPSMTCVNPAFGGGFQVSLDGTTFFTIQGLSVTTLVAPLRTITTATGAARYLRFNISAFDTTNCVASTVDYEGVLFPAPSIPVPLALDVLGAPTFIQACTGSTQQTVTAGNTIQVLALVVGATIRLCGWTMSMSATGTAQIVTGTGVNCGTGTLTQPAFTLATGIPWSVGGGVGVVLVLPTSFALCVAATTGNVSVIAYYAQY